MNWNFSSLVCGKDFLFAIDCKLEAIKIFFLTLGSVAMFFFAEVAWKMEGFKLVS